MVWCISAFCQRLQLVYELRERNPLIPFSLQSLRFPQVAEVSDSWIALVSKGDHGSTCLMERWTETKET